MGVADKEHLHQSLKTCFDLAVHVSPLVLLHNLPAQISIIRPKLIQVSPGPSWMPRVHTMLTLSQWGQDLGPKPDYVVAAEEAIWAVIIGIAMGRDSCEQLEWFVQSKSAEFGNLEANADNVGKYFLNGYIDPKGDVDPDEDVQMSMDHDIAPNDECHGHRHSSTKSRVVRIDRPLISPWQALGRVQWRHRRGPIHGAQ